MMDLLESALKPLERLDGRRATHDVFETLQNAILCGALPPGMVLSQVALANTLGVSRTPVREAVRMLQEGGLLIAEPNYRCRVVGFDPADIDALYIKRMLLESFSVFLTTQNISAHDIGELRSVKLALESDQAHGDFGEWQRLHRSFHSLISSGVSKVMSQDLEALELRSERYQYTYKGAHLPGWWLRGEAEHKALFEAIENRQAGQAGELAARHLARTAMELLAALAPEHDTSALRSTLSFVSAGMKGI